MTTLDNMTQSCPACDRDLVAPTMLADHTCGLEREAARPKPTPPLNEEVEAALVHLQHIMDIAAATNIKGCYFCGFLSSCGHDCPTMAKLRSHHRQQAERIGELERQLEEANDEIERMGYEMKERGEHD